LSEHEEEEITLEEQIKILQEQGLPPEKVVEEILKEDINADVNILAETLKMDKMDIGRIKGRLSSAKKRRAAKVAPGVGEKAAGEVPPEGLYKTEPDVNSILEEILSTHPDVPPKVKDEVMDWARRRGSLDPGFVAWLLSSMRGVSSTTAHVVSQKYALALQKAQMEGRIQLPSGYPLYPALPPAPQWGFPQAFPTGLPSAAMSGVGGIPSAGVGAPQYSTLPQYGVQPSAAQYGAAPQYGMFPPWQPPQDVRSIVREEVRAIEERLKPKEAGKEAETYVDIEEPVRLPDGRVVVGDDDRPIMRRIRVPASQAGMFAPREDAETRVLEKLKAYKDLFGGKELTEEKIREIMRGSREELTEAKIRDIIREERPPASAAPTEKPITLEDVQKSSTEAAQKAAQSAVATVLEAHEKEDHEEKRHKEVIAAIERSGSARAVEGYREDSYRILGQGMSEAAGAVRERHPLEVIIKDGGRIILGGTPEKEIEAGAGEGLLKRLKERGWVVEQ